MGMTAMKVRDLDDFTGSAALYRLSEPLVDLDWDDAERGRYEYVVVSATVVPYSAPETYIFPSNEDGEVVSWSELNGSFRGGLDHAKALRGAGYEVA